MKEREVRSSTRAQSRSDPHARRVSPEHGTDVSPLVDDVLASPGHTLVGGETKELFEARFAHDFSRVRVHTDPRASQRARLLGARAFTVGQHITFGAGQFAPATPAGQELLAHELTHTIQQSGLGRGHRVCVSDEPQLEYQATRTAQHVVRSCGRVPVASRVTDSDVVLQRERGQSVSISLHPEETQTFSGVVRLPGNNVVFYSVEVTRILPLFHERAELECESGVVAALRQVSKSGPLPTGLPTLRLQIDAGYSKAMRKGHIERLVRRAARRELKHAIAAAVTASMAEGTAQLVQQALHGVKAVIPGAAPEPPEEETATSAAAVDVDEEQVAGPAPIEVAEECDESDPNYVQCLKEERAGHYRRGIKAAGEAAAAAADVAFPVQSALFGPEPESTGDPGALAKLPKVGRLWRIFSRAPNIKQPNVLVALRRAGSKDPLDPRIMEAVMLYRAGPGKNRFRQNFGAARVRFKDGSTAIIKGTNVRRGTHSEEEILGVLDDIRREVGDLSGVVVEQIFSERIPCANCMNEVIKKHMGREIDVFYFLGESEGRLFRGRKLKNLYYD